MSEAHKLAVIGCGHVGAVTAACFADLGHTVVGIDVDEGLVSSLNSGVLPFIEPGLDELFKRHSGTDKLQIGRASCRERV